MLTVFELVQDEIRRRKEIGKQLSGSGLFACKVVCTDCGGFYGSKVWDSNNKHRRFIWRCNRKYENNNVCLTPHLTEEELKTAFVAAFNRLVAGRERYISECEAQIEELTDTSRFDEETARLEMECTDATSKAQSFVGLNASTAQDQARYQREYDELTSQYNAAKSRLQACKREKLEHTAQREKTRQILDILRNVTNPITAFDDRLWQQAVDIMRVGKSADITVAFKSGTEILVPVGEYSR
jgi:hypothetical protein